LDDDYDEDEVRKIVTLFRGESYARGAATACIVITFVESLRPSDNLTPAWAVAGIIFLLIVILARSFWPWLADPWRDRTES
jgi:hypothetical protein